MENRMRYIFINNTMKILYILLLVSSSAYAAPSNNTWSVSPTNSPVLLYVGSNPKLYSVCYGKVPQRRAAIRLDGTTTINMPHMRKGCIDVEGKKIEIISIFNGPTNGKYYYKGCN